MKFVPLIYYLLLGNNKKMYKFIEWKYFIKADIIWMWYDFYLLKELICLMTVYLLKSAKYRRKSYHIRTISTYLVPIYYQIHENLRKNRKV